MLKRFVLAFAILGLAVASAESYRVTLSQPSTVKGKQLKAGEYRLNVENSKLTIVNGKPVYGEGDYSNLNKETPEVIPAWSPVKYYGGYQNK